MTCNKCGGLVIQSKEWTHTGSVTLSKCMICGKDFYEPFAKPPKAATAKRDASRIAQDYLKDYCYSTANEVAEALEGHTSIQAGQVLSSMENSVSVRHGSLYIWRLQTHPSEPKSITLKEELYRVIGKSKGYTVPGLVALFRHVRMGTIRRVVQKSPLFYAKAMTDDEYVWVVQRRGYEDTLGQRLRIKREAVRLLLNGNMATNELHDRINEPSCAVRKILDSRKRLFFKVGTTPRLGTGGGPVNVWGLAPFDAMFMMQWKADTLISDLKAVNALERKWRKRSLHDRPETAI